MPARTLVLLACCAGLALPAAAHAQQSPFGPIPQAPPETQPAPAPTTSSNTDDGGLNRTQEILIGVAGIVLLVGIGWAIVRDARSAAPVDREHPMQDPDRPKATRAPPRQRVKTSRTRAKAARQARKRNR